MEEKKQITINLNDDIAEKVHSWAQFLGISLDAVSMESLFSKRLNYALAKKMQTLHEKNQMQEVQHMKTTTKWTDGLAFVMETPVGATMNMDVRAEDGSKGNGVSPMEAVLGGLAGCMGIDMVTILRPYKDKITSMELETDAERNAEQPHYFTAVHLTVRIEGDVPGDRVWRAVHLSNNTYCSVTNSLKATMSYTVIVNGDIVPDPKATNE